MRTFIWPLCRGLKPLATFSRRYATGKIPPPDNFWNHRWRFCLRLFGLLLVWAGCWFTVRPALAQSCPLYPAPRDRFGFNMTLEPKQPIEAYDVGKLNARWYLDYLTRIRPPRPANLAYAQMIRPDFWRSSTFTQTTEATLQANPGTLWIVGNEPDRGNQDGLRPEEFATFYHGVYSFLKTRDPHSRLAIGGVVQSTPLRRHYLELTLAAYQNQYGHAMPIDVWTIHAFILPENYVWGASIPPGMEAFAHEGMQYSVEDHGNITIFQENILAFRHWMNAHGYRDRPLIVTEYGILLSPLEGYEYEVVRDFMLASFDYLRTATDGAVGYAADENRLVQSWSWFSLNFPSYDEETGEGFNGNLFEPVSRQMLPLGQDFANYVGLLDNRNQVNLAVEEAVLSPAQIVLTPDLSGFGSLTDPGSTKVQLMATETPALTLTANVSNLGNTTACNLLAQLTHLTPEGAMQYQEAHSIPSTLIPTAAGGTGVPIQFQWRPTALPAGQHTLTLRVTADNSSTGLPFAEKETSVTLLVLTRSYSDFIFLPMMVR